MPFTKLNDEERKRLIIQAHGLTDRVKHMRWRMKNDPHNEDRLRLIVTDLPILVVMMVLNGNKGMSLLREEGEVFIVDRIC